MRFNPLIIASSIQRWHFILKSFGESIKFQSANNRVFNSEPLAKSSPTSSTEYRFNPLIIASSIQSSLPRGVTRQTSEFQSANNRVFNSEARQPSRGGGT